MLRVAFFHAAEETNVGSRCPAIRHRPVVQGQRFVEGTVQTVWSGNHPRFPLTSSSPSDNLPKHRGSPARPSRSISVLSYPPPLSSSLPLTLFLSTSNSLSILPSPDTFIMVRVLPSLQADSCWQTPALRGRSACHPEWKN